jgi:hypothetical protein
MQNKPSFEDCTYIGSLTATQIAHAIYKVVVTQGHGWHGNLLEKEIDKILVSDDRRQHNKNNELRRVILRVVEWMDANGYGENDQSFGARASLANDATLTNDNVIISFGLACALSRYVCPVCKRSDGLGVCAVCIELRRTINSF